LQLAERRPCETCRANAINNVCDVVRWIVAKVDGRVLIGDGEKISDCVVGISRVEFGRSPFVGGPVVCVELEAEDFVGCGVEFVRVSAKGIVVPNSNLVFAMPE